MPHGGDLLTKLHVPYLNNLSGILCNNMPFLLLLGTDNKICVVSRLKSGKTLRSLHITIINNILPHLYVSIGFFQCVYTFTLRAILQGRLSMQYYLHFIDKETEIQKCWKCTQVHRATTTASKKPHLFQFLSRVTSTWPLWVKLYPLIQDRKTLSSSGSVMLKS